jgi:hypothetical protein
MTSFYDEQLARARKYEEMALKYENDCVRFSREVAVSLQKTLGYPPASFKITGGSVEKDGQYKFSVRVYHDRGWADFLWAVYGSKDGWLFKFSELRAPIPFSSVPDLLPALTDWVMGALQAGLLEQYPGVL